MSTPFPLRAATLLLLATAAASAGPNFEEVSEKAGIAFRMAFLPGEQGEKFKINFYDHGCGVAVGDYDGDGDDDLYFCNQLGPNALYRNNGDGTFADATAAAGPIALSDRICVAAVFNDYDNDGDQDLFVISTRGGNALFRNEGGKFTDVTGAAGVKRVAHSQSATFFDADHDGDLDLFVSNTARWTSEKMDAENRYHPGPSYLFDLVDSPIELNTFYRNNGDGTFTEATVDARLQGAGWGGDTAVFDYDEDGDSDLFVANMFGSSILYRNDGKGVFEDVTEQTVGKTPFGTVGTRAFDYDRDGRLDLYVVDMHSDMWMNTDYDPTRIEETKKYQWYFGRRHEEADFQKRQEQVFANKINISYRAVFFGNGLYRNLGGGKFEEVSESARAETFWPWGIAEGDYDNDGFEDAFLPSGMGYPFWYFRSPLMMNNGDGTFTDRCKEAGMDPLPGGIHLPLPIGNKPATRSSRSAATLDFDGDGRLDIVVNNFNDRPFLYRNGLMEQRNFVALRLRGTRSNRDAIGAVVRIWLGDTVMVRQVQAAGGYLSQSTKTVHFGLGDATAIDRCEIRWPSGCVQKLDKLEINKRHEVVEPGE